MFEKISALPRATTVASNDDVMLNQGGITKVVNVGLVTGLAVQAPVIQVASFASLPVSPLGLYLVTADESKGGNPSIYFITPTARYWFAMVQDS